MKPNLMNYKGLLMMKPDYKNMTRKGVGWAQA